MTTTNVTAVTPTVLPIKPQGQAGDSLVSATENVKPAPIAEIVVPQAASITVANAASQVNLSVLEEKSREFKTLIEEINYLGSLSSLANWDNDVFIPDKGTDYRGQQMSYLASKIHTIKTSDQMGELLKFLKEDSNFNRLGKEDKALVKKIFKIYEKAKKIPLSFVEEEAELTSKANSVWKAARKAKNFNDFAPTLEKIVAMKRKYADLIGYEGSPYNALLDHYEPGLTTDKVDRIFEGVKQKLIPFIRKINQVRKDVDYPFMHRTFDHKKQLDLSKDILELMGFDFTRGRIDEPTHPFCTTLGPDDVRLVTRIHDNDFYSGISSSMHEGGHGLYEQGMPPDLFNVNFEGASMGIHESQSRLYENFIGKGKSFWKYYFPKLQERFPEQLHDVTLDEFYKAINQIKSSMIRIESDEATYNLHIILRYEIERDLIEGRLEVKDIPQVWNKKMEEYLGITPKDDAEGALQDVHWAAGLFGYFPTYTIGNLYSAQIYNQAKKEIPDLESKIEAGNLKPLRKWLGEKVHSIAWTETPDEIIQRVTKEALNPDYFTKYIENKFSEIYPLA